MNKYAGSRPISKVEITNDTLTGQGGLTPFVRYLSQINIYPILIGSFGHIRKSKKGMEKRSLSNVKPLPRAN